MSILMCILNSLNDLAVLNIHRKIILQPKEVLND